MLEKAKEINISGKNEYQKESVVEFYLNFSTMNTRTVAIRTFLTHKLTTVLNL